VKDSTRRAIRTGYQSLIAALPVFLIVAVWMRDLFPAGTPLAQWTLTISAFMAAFTAAVSKLVNALEAAGRIPAWLKQPPATPTNPDPESPPVTH
jgi:hypothetical protein